MLVDNASLVFVIAQCGYGITSGGDACEWRCLVMYSCFRLHELLPQKKQMLLQIHVLQALLVGVQRDQTVLRFLLYNLLYNIPQVLLRLFFKPLHRNKILPSLPLPESSLFIPSIAILVGCLK